MMVRTLCSAIYGIGMLFAEGLRLPRRIDRIRDRERWARGENRHQTAEIFVLLAVVSGFWVLPAIYIFTSWLAGMDYRLPDWVIWPAGLLFITSLGMRWAAQRKLAKGWSFTLETVSGHVLIQDGIFAFTRHPIYCSLIFWAIAQPLLLQNFLAGLGGAVAVLLIWGIRVPREEQMMIDIFGDQYRQYMLRTGWFHPHRDTKNRPAR
jgi:protein-S-isoprenylcysteine O-methyltransferase Ste14